jgi:hypothetical protein
MNENAKRWVAELRSGKYQQCRDALFEVDPEGKPCEFCCLGVANEISGLGKWSGNSYFVPGNGDEPSFAHEKVADWLGLLDQRGDLRDGSGFDSLADLNDAGASFAEIADIIEKNAGLLFRRDDDRTDASPNSTVD